MLSLAVDVLFILRKIISSILLATFVLLAFATGRVWYTANHVAPVKSDAIVVLGAAQFDGKPSPVFTTIKLKVAGFVVVGLVPSTSYSCFSIIRPIACGLFPLQ